MQLIKEKWCNEDTRESKQIQFCLHFCVVLEVCLIDLACHSPFTLETRRKYQYTVWNLDHFMATFSKYLIDQIKIIFFINFSKFLSSWPEVRNFTPLCIRKNSITQCVIFAILWPLFQSIFLPKKRFNDNCQHFQSLLIVDISKIVGHKSGILPHCVLMTEEQHNNFFLY